MQNIHNNLVSNLRKFFKKSWCSRWVVGLSWWIDSALTLKLSVEAIWKKNITAIMMPESEFSSKKNLNDAISLAKDLWIKYDIIDISKFIELFENLPWWKNEIAEMNIRARLRMCILYHYANTNNAIVLWTWNKTEIILGYWTKYWDFWVDIEVIWNLYKTEVWKLAKYLKLPKIFITKKPSAELKNWHTDEDEIWFSYQEIDDFLKWPGYLEESKLFKNTTQIQNPYNKFLPLLQRIEKNKHKTKKIPVIKIN